MKFFLAIVGRLKAMLTPNAVPHDRFAQRRRHLRVTVPPTVVTCHVGRSSFSATVCDVSARGARVVTTRRLARNSEISVMSRDDRGSDAVPVVRMKVVWTRCLSGRFEAGLRCLDDNTILGRSWMMRLLKEGCGSASSSTDRRKRARVTTALEARARASEELRVHLVDLSTGGACIQTNAHLAPGTSISLVLAAVGDSRGVTLNAEVVRASRRDGERLVHLRFGTLQFEDRYRLEQHLARLMQQAS